jgi:hypothetical protein
MLLMLDKDTRADSDMITVVNYWTEHKVSLSASNKFFVPGYFP